MGKRLLCFGRAGASLQRNPHQYRQGDQVKSEFLKISPNNKMPAIVDGDGPGSKTIAIFESGAILIYLAEKTGRLMPTDTQSS
jgi:GST-like protein